MGVAEIKYGDSTVIIQHKETGLWLSYLVRYNEFFKCLLLHFKLYLQKLNIYISVFPEESVIDDLVAYCLYFNNTRKNSCVMINSALPIVMKSGKKSH